MSITQNESKGATFSFIFLNQTTCQLTLGIFYNHMSFQKNLDDGGKKKSWGKNREETACLRDCLAEAQWEEPRLWSCQDEELSSRATAQV